MPQFLKILPVYINSLRKSEVLLPGLRSSVHQRLQLRSFTVSMDTRSTAAQLYPLILPLVSVLETLCSIMVNQHSDVVLSQVVNGIMSHCF